MHSLRIENGILFGYNKVFSSNIIQEAVTSPGDRFFVSSPVLHPLFYVHFSALYVRVSVHFSRYYLGLLSSFSVGFNPPPNFRPFVPSPLPNIRPFAIELPLVSIGCSSGAHRMLIGCSLGAHYDVTLTSTGDNPNSFTLFL